MKLFQLFRIYANWKKGALYPSTPPARLWIETSSQCNLSCPLCLNRSLEPSQRGLMDVTLFRSIIDQMDPGLQDAYLHHRGEPLLNPAVVTMVRYAADKGVRTRMHTNGLALTPDVSAGLVESGLEQITFSLDSLDREAYEKKRPGSDLETVLQNIKHFLTLRSGLRNRKPVVHVLLMDETAGRRRPNGTLPFEPDKLIVRKPHNWGGSLHRNKGDFSGKLLQCTFPWYAMVILFDGNVCLCPQDFFGSMRIGNAADTSLEDLWLSEEAAALREKCVKKQFDDTDPCTSCDRICRRNIFGIPVEYLSKFLKEMI